jgi:hypothetical protein
VDEPQQIRPTDARVGSYVGLGAGYLLIGALLLVWLSSTPTGIMWLALGVLCLAFGLLKRSTRVIVDTAGVGLTNALRRRYRWMAWSQVRDVRLDPPGGPRLLTVAMRGGHEHRLPPLSEPDTGAVLEAFRRSR